jgi:hypothetical protein
MEYTWADHLILGVIFFTHGQLSYIAKWQHSGTHGKCASGCAKLDVGISPHSLCWSLSVNTYLQCALHLTMEGKVQQHMCIDFCFLLGKTGAETYKMLQAVFGESCLSRMKTFEWYSHFKSGRWSFEDDPHPGRPSTSNTKETVARVPGNIHADWRLIIREVA